MGPRRQSLPDFDPFTWAEAHTLQTLNWQMRGREGERGGCVRERRGFPPSDPSMCIKALGHQCTNRLWHFTAHFRRLHIFMWDFLLLTLWVFVSHFGRLCWGRVSVRQPANMQLHRRRTGGEAVGVVGEHPIEEKIYIYIYHIIFHYVTYFLSVWLRKIIKKAEWTTGRRKKPNRLHVA